MGRMSPASAAEEALPEKGKRVPFGGLSQKLAVYNKDPNYFYCWFRDQGDTLQRAQAAWYEFVSPREARGVKIGTRDVHGGNQSVLGDRYEVFGGRDEFGRGYNMVLMRQEIQYYQEDMAVASTSSDQIDHALRRQASEPGRYGETRLSSQASE